MQIKNNNGFDILLTSWTPPMMNKNKIKELIKEGEEYIKMIDAVVKDNYKDNNVYSLDYCKKTVELLGLPPFLINPIVDKTFKSHLK